jgi:hypothetical protein
MLVFIREGAAAVLCPCGACRARFECSDVSHKCATRSASRLHGPLVVSMRPLIPTDAIRPIRIISRFPTRSRRTRSHRLSRSDRHSRSRSARLRRSRSGRNRQVAGLLGMGVAEQAAIAAARPPSAITHTPGCMLVIDLEERATRHVLTCASIDSFGRTGARRRRAPRTREQENKRTREQENKRTREQENKRETKTCPRLKL